jgi:hypothetical protein
VMAESSQRNGSATLPAEALQRGTTALQTIMKSLGAPAQPATEEPA